jgi:uncharacterized lipoprotein YmbA
MNVFFRGIAASVLLFSLIAAGGCASTPARFYTLNSLITTETPVKNVSDKGSFITVIGPVTLPGYLDRPQVVVRSGQNELKLSEYDRWAGPLESDISRVLVENLSALLVNDHATVLRWEPSVQALVPVKYRVSVALTRFEGAPGGSVLLKAQWSIFSQDRRLLLTKESGITEQVNGNSYDSLVAAMSKALESLSRDIAGAVTTLSRQAGQ